MSRASTLAPELWARISVLSPAKQALLVRRLAERGAARRTVGPARIAPRGTTEPAPLSYAQELLWVREQMAPDSAAYHMPVARRICSALDADALEWALSLLVTRHEALRTRLVEVAGAATQVVVPPRTVRLERHDLRSLGHDAREAACTRLLREAAVRPFVLAEGTFPRAAVVQLADEEFVLLLVLHHIVVDGASIDILLADVAAAYDARRAGDVPRLGTTALQMADYATWERHELTATRLEPALAYWRAALGDAPSGVDLHTDFPRPASAIGPGARVVLTLSDATLDAVRTLARAHDVTPFVVLLSALQVLLFRHSGQSDLVVGAPIARRERTGTERIVGNLASTLPLRGSLSAEMTFADLLRATRQRVLQAFEHQDVPYEYLVRELRSDRPIADQALFRVLFAMQDATAGLARLGGVPMEPVAVDVGSAKFDLALSAVELPHGLRLAAEYRRDLFHHETIERMVEQLGLLVREGALAPQRRIVALPLMDRVGRERLLVEWAGPRVRYTGGDTLVELLAAQVARTPDTIAVLDERESLSYAALDARAAHLALALRARGVGPGTLVGVSAERSTGLVVGLLAILKAGGAYVPIDPEYPADRVAYMLSDSAVPVLLTQRHLVSRLPAHSASLLLVDDPTQPWASNVAPPTESFRAPDAADPAYMIYTSGSTGKPKGALNSHRGIVNRLQWMQAEYRLTADDVVLQKTPMSFDVSVWEFFWPLIAGARLVLARPGGHRDPAYLAATIALHGVTVCHFVPAMLRAFLAGLESRAGSTATQPRGSLRAVMASGEALAPDLVAAFHRALPDARLYNLYGPTECAVDVSHWPCPQTAIPPAVVPIGRPVANTRLYVLDPHGSLAPIGVPGELYLAGVQVGLGYHRRPELTAERFLPDPYAPATEPMARMYRTGDRARWLADGTAEYLGRLDFQVKVRGVRIELGEIEAALLDHAAVAEAAVVVRDETGTDPLLVGYVVFRAGAERAPDLAELHAHLGRRLPIEMRPTALVVLERLPLSPSGKLDRRALPAPHFEPMAAAVPPRDDVERVIAGVWTAVLGRDVTSVNANFLELGGHSLLATRITGQLSRIFRVDFSLRVFFEHPTVAGLASALTGLEVRPGLTAQIARLLLAAQQMTPEERERVRQTKTSPAPTTGPS